MIRVGLAAAMGAAALTSARRARTAAVRARVRPTGSADASWLPSAVRAHLATALARAGLAADPETTVTTWALATTTAVVAMGAVALALIPVALLGALAVPPVLLVAARGRADRRFAAALPDALRSLAADLRAGASLPGAIARLATGPSPVAPDLARVARRLELGASMPDAVAPWLLERPDPNVAAVVGALRCVDEVGGGAARALDGLARSLADRLALVAEVRAQSAQARVSAIVVALAPLGYLAFAAVVDRDALGALVLRPVGRICLGVGLGLDLLAVLWMRRIVRAPEALG